jgi:DNA-binding PadR family transcriptional regulator
MTDWREQLKQDAKYVLLTNEGENLLEDLKRRYGFYKPTFRVDPYETAYAEGQRSVLLFILSLLADEKPPEGETIV